MVLCGLCVSGRGKGVVGGYWRACGRARVLRVYVMGVEVVGDVRIRACRVGEVYIVGGGMVMRV